MNATIALFRKLLITLLQGAAFGLGLIGVIYIYIFIMKAPQTSTELTVKDQQSLPAYKAPTSEEFVISDTNVIHNPPLNANISGLPAQMDIIGSIENKGADADHFVNIYADLYDKSGKFIFQCSDQIPNIKHNEKLNFLIKCYTLPAGISTQYASNKVYAKSNG